MGDSDHPLAHETPQALLTRLEASAQRGHRVWGFIRVSEKKQLANESLKAQEEDIRRYCVAKHLTEPQFVVEVSSAAKPVFNVSLPGAPPEPPGGVEGPALRPKFLLLLGHLREYKDSHLIVWKLDRLTRVDYEQELFLNMLRRDRVVVHSVQPGEAHMLDGGHVTDPARVFTRQIMAAAAQYDRALIELRMKMGMTYKAARGGFTGGQPPFGYKVVKGELVPDEARAAMVKYIFSLRRKYGMWPTAIADYITANSPADGVKYDRQKVTRILKAVDLYQHGKYKDCYGVSHDRPDLIILPNDEELLDHAESHR